MVSYLLTLTLFCSPPSLPFVRFVVAVTGLNLRTFTARQQERVRIALGASHPTIDSKLVIFEAMVSPTPWVFCAAHSFGGSNHLPLSFYRNLSSSMKAHWSGTGFGSRFEHV